MLTQSSTDGYRGIVGHCRTSLPEKWTRLSLIRHFRSRECAFRPGRAPDALHGTTIALGSLEPLVRVRWFSACEKHWPEYEEYIDSCLWVDRRAHCRSACFRPREEHLIAALAPARSGSAKGSKGS